MFCLRVYRLLWFSRGTHVNEVWLGVVPCTAGLTLGSRHLPNYKVALWRPVGQRTVSTRWSIFSDHNAVFHLWISWKLNIIVNTCIHCNIKLDLNSVNKSFDIATEASETSCIHKTKCILFLNGHNFYCSNWYNWTTLSISYKRKHFLSRK